MSSGYILAIDIGEQGTSCGVYNPDTMRCAAREFEEANLLTPEPGVAYQQPDDIMGSVRRTISRVLSDAAIQGEDIRAVCVTGQPEGIIGVEADGSAATVYDSGKDTRCVKYAEEMSGKAGKKIIRMTGSPVACGQGPKIVWMLNDDRPAYDKSASFVPLHAFAAMQMCGLDATRAYTDNCTLSYSGFANNAKREWSVELLDMFGVDRLKMPRILAPGEKVGTISAEFAKSTGLVEGTPVAAGTCDTVASIFATNMSEPGRVEDWSGTANMLVGVVDSFRPDTEHGVLQLMRSPIEGAWYACAAAAGGGLAMRWFAEAIAGSAEPDYVQLDEEARNVPIGCDGVLYIPDISGQVPETAPGTKAGYIGLDWATTRAHMYRAILESVCYDYAADMAIMRELYPSLDFSMVYAAGGAAQSAFFNQMKADSLGTKVRTYMLDDTALAGAAILGAMAAGEIRSPKAHLEKAGHSDHTFDPDPARKERYDAARKAYADKQAAINKALGA